MDKKDLKVHLHSVTNRSVFFQITSTKTWISCKLIQVWLKSESYVTIKFVHANSLGKLLLISIRHKGLQPSVYLSGLLCMCGKLAEVLASKCCLANCCSQRVDRPFKGYRHWQCNQYSSSERMWTKRSTTVHSHCFFFPLTAYLYPFGPSYFYS